MGGNCKPSAGWRGARGWGGRRRSHGGVVLGELLPEEDVCIGTLWEAGSGFGYGRGGACLCVRVSVCFDVVSKLCMLLYGVCQQSLRCA